MNRYHSVNCRNLLTNIPLQHTCTESPGSVEGGREEEEGGKGGREGGREGTRDWLGTSERQAGS